MKILILIINLFLCYYLSAQTDPLAQIEGRLEVWNGADISSIFIGKNAGLKAGQLIDSENTFLGVNSGTNTIPTSNPIIIGAEIENNGEGNWNSFFGANTGISNISGRENSFFGKSAGEMSISGDRNSFFGSNSGMMNLADFNSFFGANSGKSNTEGNFNCFYGNSARAASTTADENSFFGALAGLNSIDGGFNSFFGSKSGMDNSRGQFNSFFGRESGKKNEHGSANTYIGFQSGLNSKGGTNNVMVGAISGYALRRGSGNICIGYSAGPSTQDSFSNKMYIDNQVSDTPLIYGEFDTDILTINGTFRLNSIDYNNDGVANESVIESGTSLGSDLWLSSKDDVKIQMGNIFDSESNFYITTIQSQSSLPHVFEIDTLLSLSKNGDLEVLGSLSHASDRNRKEEIIKIDAETVLEKLTHIPIMEWQYKGTSERHIGPMAQDFYAAFGLGQGETTIATVDADGVSLAAIQALHKRSQKSEQQVQELQL